ncbi:MAG: hypothetical protein ACREBQ_13250, partial [Nitrososphaerales archaeon]
MGKRDEGEYFLPHKAQKPKPSPEGLCLSHVNSRLPEATGSLRRSPYAYTRKYRGMVYGIASPNVGEITKYTNKTAAAIIGPNMKRKFDLSKRRIRSIIAKPVA